MKRKITALITGVLLLASFIYYVTNISARQNLDVGIVESHYYENIGGGGSQLLFNQPVVGSGAWDATFNSVSSNYGRNFNVYYRNSHPDQARVRLQRRTITGWSDVDSIFNVPGKSELTVTRRAAPNTEHRLLIENLTGANVSGEVRVRQL